MQERICNGDSFDAVIENDGQPECDCKRRRFSHLQRLAKVGKLSCCSFVEDDVPSTPWQPPDRREHKPFNGICVLPNMPDVDTLIQEFEASYAPSTSEKKNREDVAKSKGMFVKRIIEIYEMKNGEADQEATVEDKRKPKKNRSGGLFSAVTGIQTPKKPEERRDGAEKRELADATDPPNCDSRRAGAGAARENDNDEEEIDRAEEPLELTVATPDPRASSLKREEGKTKEKGKGKSSRKLRRLLGKFSRSDSRRATRRCRLPFSRQDDLWHIKRKGRIFSGSPVNVHPSVRGSGEAIRAISPCAAGGGSRDVHDDDKSPAIVESQDDSGNSYKNLQIEMFDFEEEGRWSEPREDIEDFDDSLSIRSVDRFLPSLDRRNSFDEITCLVSSSSFEDDTNDCENTETSAVVDESAEDAEHSAQRSKLYKKLSGRKSLKKMLSFFKTKRYFEKKAKNPVDKAKFNWRDTQRKSQCTMLSPDSGFGEQSASSPGTSFLTAEKSASNVRHEESPLTFRTFRPSRDSPPRDGVSKWKRRPVLNELSRENSSSVAGQTSRHDLFPANSPPRILKHPYVKVFGNTYLSLTRVDEVGEQLDVSELRHECSTSWDFSQDGWVSSSPYHVCEEPRWRSTPTLASFARESSFHEPFIQGKKPRINNVCRHDARRKPIFSTGSVSSISGSPCFATVKPRNWRSYMRPERSSEEDGGIRRRASL
ncbi:PREDICTED: uncharacterized protein LOC106745526 [Dinoponera quadriceps]|uniref:Uncharacterized protein LOC106745526 n=1 Tax=Dinoponera quadriceps TaxID=609295 RepID=A0A6P3XEA7_DINQU|nr:PREDICTED: uncharacterized protein LOC106745526 [Dinoponera quadriceps]